MRTRGAMKPMWRSTLDLEVSWYLNTSQCILATLKPGKVKRAPIRPHQSAMKNLRTSLEAGPELSRPALVWRKAAAELLKLL